MSDTHEAQLSTASGRRWKLLRRPHLLLAPSATLFRVRALGRRRSSASSDCVVGYTPSVPGEPWLVSHARVERLLRVSCGWHRNVHSQRKSQAAIRSCQDAGWHEHVLFLRQVSHVPRGGGSTQRMQGGATCRRCTIDILLCCRRLSDALCVGQPLLRRLEQSSSLSIP